METTNNKKEETVDDWKVAFLCSIIRFIHTGLLRIDTILFVHCIERYTIDRQKAAIPLIVAYVLCTLLGPFFGYLESFFQIRTIVITGCILMAVGMGANFWAEDIIFLIIFWGILFGTGLGICFALLPELLNRHFNKHFTQANVIFLVGGSLGSTALPFLAKILLDRYGLSGTFLILGGIALNAIPASMALTNFQTRSTPRVKNSRRTIQNQKVYSITKDFENGSTSLKKSSSSLNPEKIDDEIKLTSFSSNNTIIKTSTVQSCIQNNASWKAFSIFLNPTFLVIGLSQSGFIGICSILNIILYDYCLGKGTISVDQSIWIMTGFSLSDIVARIGLGWVVDYGYVGVVNFVAAGFVALGLVYVLFVWTSNFLSCLLTALLLGLSFGIILTYSPTIIKDYFDGKERVMVVSSRNFFFGPLAIAIPPIIGYFKDTVQSYDGLQYICAATSFACALLTLTIPLLAKRQRNLNEIPQKINE